MTHGGITKLDFVYAVQYQGQAIVAIVIGLSVNLKAPMEGVKGKSQPTPWLQSYRTYRPVPHLHHFTVALFLSLEGLTPGTGIRQFCTCFFRASTSCHLSPFRPKPSPEPQRHHLSSSYSAILGGEYVYVCTRSFRLPAAANLPLSGTRSATIDFLDAGRSLLTFSSPFPRTLLGYYE